MAKPTGPSNGSPPKALPPAPDLAHLRRVFEPLPIKPEALRAFPHLPGSDTEPWDVLLQALALDELTALRMLAERTGLKLEHEPRLQDSAGAFYERVPPSIARAHQVAGVASDELGVTVATSQPMQPPVFSMLEDRLDAPIRLVLAPRAAVTNLINRGYEQRQDLVTEIVEELPLDQRAIESAAGSIRQGTDLLALARQGPVIRLVNMILFEALRRRASDIHIHPMETRLVIRFRVDGMLIDAFAPPLALAPAISSRLKVMTELDIANRHSPQDGHTTVRVGSRKIDIRVSVIPNVYGERTVLRLLDQSQTQLSLDQIGMGRPLQGRFVRLMERPNGIILVTGPTGSGKTTTLYGALASIDRSSRNVMTIEDPVEYHLEGISQTQVNVKRGVTFAAGLRALLRQDPDVILVGEIRDRETAELATQASLTGHLVLATLHTNDAPSAISRLVDIGIEPYLITSTLLAVIAQRLVRKLCPQCAGSGRLQHDRCDRCLGTGYFGRQGIFELMVMDDTLRRLAGQNADSISLGDAARKAGMHTLRDDALERVRDGVTSEAEILRVLGQG
ncbi:MAG: type II secretion system protein GspE [Planctomyces sp.]|nr:type II secretion system protein GspE [Planctomyces sp.]MBA4120729.1 type II secretion system protein GspE [Isosphaera sp.]